jgi:riboflavin synthase
MFTGIIQSIGKIKRVRRSTDGISFVVAASGSIGKISPGDSISINGVCQTVEQANEEEFTFTAVGETLRKTTMAGLSSGKLVNLEAAATLDTALGGHLVQGHVDGVGTVLSFLRLGKDRVLSIKLPPEIFEQVVPKGSIAVDGISLTVMETGVGNTVKVSIVPFTLQHTIIKDYRSGTKVNIETDIIGKYILAYLARSPKMGERG